LRSLIKSVGIVERKGKSIFKDEIWIYISIILFLEMNLLKMESMIMRGVIE